jgi:hypothetical protein
MANVSIAYVWLARLRVIMQGTLLGQIQVANCMQPLAIPGWQHQIIVLIQTLVNDLSQSNFLAIFNTRAPKVQKHPAHQMT